MLTTFKRDAYDHMRKHAGWRVGHNAEDAANLARAERFAWEQDWQFEWVDDTDCYDYFDADCCQEAREYEDKREELNLDYRGEHRHDIMGCILRDADGEQLGSLWGIMDADRNYMRVIQAELAYEAWYPIREDAQRISTWMERIAS